MTNTPQMRYSLATGFMVALSTLISDQLSKWYLIEIINLPSRQVIEVSSFFNLAMVWNRGVSFGMFAEHDQPYILIALSLVICAILVIWLTRADKPWVSAALGLVIGGALGNVIDRLHYGAVADFFDFYIGNAHWPAFNIADSCIFIGVVLLCIDSMFMQHKQGNE
ncbi:MAG: signal peptidase II [Rickettsiales bacterium]